MNSLVNDLSNKLIYFYQPRIIETIHLPLMLIRVMEEIERTNIALPSSLKKQLTLTVLRNTINQVVDNQVEIKEMLTIIDSYGEGFIDVIISTSKGHYYINSTKRKKEEVGCCNIC